MVKNIKNSFQSLLLFLLIVTAIVALVLLVKQDIMFGTNSNKQGGEVEKSEKLTSVQNYSSTPKNIENTANDYLEATSTQLFTGNIFWARYIDDMAFQKANNVQTLPQSKNDKRDYNLPFSGLSSIIDDSFDAVIGGLECPITNKYVDSKTQNRLLKFSCLPEYLPMARKFFDIFSLANNHMNDMEEIGGFKNTQTELEKYNFQYFGNFDPSVKEDICEIINVDIKVKSKNEGDRSTVKKEKFPFAFCGYHSVFKLPTSSELDQIKLYSKYFPTIVMPHHGAEYKTKPDNIGRNLFKSMIDKGADMVIGDHPHTTQEVEAYKGKLIVYSMGNFIFDQQFSYDVSRSVAIKNVFSFDVNSIDPYLKLVKDYNCNQYKDKCLEMAAKEGLVKPKFTNKFDIIPIDLSSKITKKGDAEVLEKMLIRTDFKNQERLLK